MSEYVWYCLCYQNRNIYEIASKNYDESSFEVFYNKKRNIIKVKWSEENNVPNEASFIWNQEDDKVKIVKCEWKDELKKREISEGKIVKELKLPDLSSDWEKLRQ